MQPVPELISPGQWKKQKAVNKRSGNIDIKDKTITTPIDDSRISECLRIHEYFHLRWSPVDKILKDKLMEECVRSFEEERVNFLGTTLNIFINEITDDIKLVPTSNLLDLCIMYISSRQYNQTEDMNKLFSRIPPEIKSIIDVLIDKVRSQPTFDTVKICAQMLYNIFKNTIGEPELVRYSRGEFISQVDTILKIVDSQQSKLILDAINSSGEMTIVNPTLDNYCKSPKIKTIRYLPSEEGMYFRNIHRELLDGLIFNSNRIYHSNIGSLLIDGSGSMSINNKHIEKIVNSCSGILIAIYSGHGDNGELHIIAKKNLILRRLPYRNGGNIIDLPALQWLGRQKLPRVWLSDGQVTGKEDKTYSGITNTCKNLVKKYRICQVKDITKLNLLLEKGIRTN